MLAGTNAFGRIAHAIDQRSDGRYASGREMPSRRPSPAAAAPRGRVQPPRGRSCARQRSLRAPYAADTTITARPSAPGGDGPVDPRVWPCAGSAVSRSHRTGANRGGQVTAMLPGTMTRIDGTLRRLRALVAASRAESPEDGGSRAWGNLAALLGEGARSDRCSVIDVHAPGGKTSRVCRARAGRRPIHLLRSNHRG